MAIVIISVLCKSVKNIKLCIEFKKEFYRFRSREGRYRKKQNSLTMKQLKMSETFFKALI